MERLVTMLWIPIFKIQDKSSGQYQASVSNEGPKKNNFYVVRSRYEQEASPDMVAGMLKVFSIDV